MAGKGAREHADLIACVLVGKGLVAVLHRIGQSCDGRDDVGRYLATDQEGAKHADRNDQCRKGIDQVFQIAIGGCVLQQVVTLASTVEDAQVPLVGCCFAVISRAILAQHDRHVLGIEQCAAGGQVGTPTTGEFVLQAAYFIVLGPRDDSGPDLVVVHLFGQYDEAHGTGHQ